MSDLIKVGAAAVAGYAVAKLTARSQDINGEFGSLSDKYELDRDVIIVDRYPDSVDSGTFIIDDTASNTDDSVINRNSPNTPSGDMQYIIERDVWKVFDDLSDNGTIDDSDNSCLYQTYRPDFDGLYSDYLFLSELESARDSDNYEERISELLSGKGYDVSSSEGQDVLADFSLILDSYGTINTPKAMDLVSKIYTDLLTALATDSYDSLSACQKKIVDDVDGIRDDVKKRADITDLIINGADLSGVEVSESGILPQSGVEQDGSLVTPFNSLLKYKTDRVSDVEATNQLIQKNNIVGAFVGVNVNAVVNVGSYVSVTVANFVFQDTITSADIVNQGDTIIFSDITSVGKIIATNSFTLNYLLRLKHSKSIRRVFIANVVKTDDVAVCGCRITPKDGIGLEFASGSYTTSYKKRGLCGSKTVTVPHVAYAASLADYEFYGVECVIHHDATRIGYFGGM